MRLTSVLFGFALALVFAAMPALAQERPAVPGEVEKLAEWVGTWKYEGDAKASPLGPAAKIAGTQTGKMIMNGFFLQWTGEEKGAFGGVKWGAIEGYDASSKTYHFFGYQNDGTLSSGSDTVTDNLWKTTATITVKGVTYHLRTDGVFAADRKTFTWKEEISTDGKSWALWDEGKMTKTK